MNRLEGIDLREKKGSTFIFNMYLTDSMKALSLESMDLSVRAFHSLKREGYNTVGELTEAIRGGKNLSSIRNCGKTSVREIMESLFFLQYYSLEPESRDDYLKEVIVMNIQKRESR
ncbi:MAG: hypothetical protein J6P45_06245 [Lachnospiraceae bacterium]|nr:hypothetical protein [Lachnospiraceae bacterium]